jgi:hypothetical protein
MLGVTRKLAVALAMAFSVAATVASQDAANAQSAPLPSQILAAKKIFISNASGQTLDGTAVSELAYNGFYAGMKTWGQYGVVSTPADADLIFEIRYEIPLGPITVFRGSGASSKLPQIRLSIFDPKTHVVLWAFSELMVSTKHKSDQEHLDETLTNLVSDVRKLVSQTPQNLSAASK